MLVGMRLQIASKLAFFVTILMAYDLFQAIYLEPILSLCMEISTILCTNIQKGVGLKVADSHLGGGGVVPRGCGLKASE